MDGSQPRGTVGGDTVAGLLREARNDSKVKAVVLRVDSPGGSAFASEVIRHEVEALKAAGKPVVVSMSSLCRFRWLLDFDECRQDCRPTDHTDRFKSVFSASSLPSRKV
uniref:hypothetical protein n=1 Tax=Vibrio cholerae TaxID=666 RepID=UPI003F58B07B